jgi:K+/H+ antiporter YhaU regulatory subunit KhtT
VLSAIPYFLTKEQSVYIKICFCLGKGALETPEMFLTAFSDIIIERTKNFKWFYLVEDCKHSGRPSSGGTEENLDRVRKIINKGQRIQMRSLNVLPAIHERHFQMFF